MSDKQKQEDVESETKDLSHFRCCLSIILYSNMVNCISQKALNSISNYLAFIFPATNHHDLGGEIGRLLLMQGGPLI